VRLALVCPYAWDAAGGVQVHVADLAAQLRARGHDVLVVAPHGPGSARRIAGTVIRVPYRGTVAPIAPSPLAIRRLRRLFAAWRPDVVHVHEPFTPSTSMWATIASPVPVVATFHAFLDRSRAYERAAPALRRIASRIARSVAVSQAAAGFLRRALPAVRPDVIPNGLDVAAFASAPPVPLPEGRRIGWVHRLDPQKGFAVALEALSDVVDAVPDARLVVAGDGPDRRLVSGLDASVRERVTLLGAVPHERVAGILRACEVAIAPATGQESFGYTLVEAMATGAPVVATDIPGYREVVRDRIDGLLVPPQDASALAASIVEVLGDPAFAADLSEAGRARAATFDWSVVVPRLERVYAEACATGAPLR
jgi:phosphatidylinositol alpha-mannosyltransferase